MATAVRKTNWFAIWVTTAVVLVVAVVAVLVWWINGAASNQANEPGAEPSSAIIDTQTGAISFGTGSNVIDTYIDFQCPACKAFEAAYGETLQEQAASNAITLNVHPISILDRASQGTQYSSRSAGAMYCVAEKDPDNALAFLQALYASQPQEGTSGLTDEQILGIASSAGVNVDDELTTCVTDGTYIKYAQSKSTDVPIQPGQNGIATPTIVLNGETIVNTTLTGDFQTDFASKFQ